MDTTVVDLFYQEGAKLVLDCLDVEDVIMGCAYPEAEQGMNFGCIAFLHTGLPRSMPAMTINWFCASGWRTIALAA